MALTNKRSQFGADNNLDAVLPPLFFYYFPAYVRCLTESYLLKATSEGWTN